MDKIKLFENQRIRTIQNVKEEVWYFSVIDVVTALTESSDPKQYLRKLRSEIQNSTPSGVQFVPLLVVLEKMEKREKY